MDISLIIWLVFIVISAVLIAYFIKLWNNDVPEFSMEGFQLQGCPSSPAGLISYVNRVGDTLCCNGEVINNQCMGNDICSLTWVPPLSGSIPLCNTYINSLQATENAAKCFQTVTGDSSMNNYFINRQTGVQGCSRSKPTADGSAPSDMSKPYCRIYPTSAENMSNYDSCYNYSTSRQPSTECTNFKTLACASPTIFTSLGATYRQGGSWQPYGLSSQYTSCLPPTITCNSSFNIGNMTFFTRNKDDYSDTEYYRPGYIVKDASNNYFMNIFVAPPTPPEGRPAIGTETPLAYSLRGFNTTDTKVWYRLTGNSCSNLKT
jgi:hypothetical protein